MPRPDDSLKLTQPHVRFFFYTGIPRPPLPNLSKLRRTCLGKDNATAKPYSVDAANSRLLSGESWKRVDGTVPARGCKSLRRWFYFDAAGRTGTSDTAKHSPAASTS